jgi:ABC-2 type transport system permease protein
MPTWLQAIAVANPLSYAVDAMRAMLLTGDYTNLPVDLLVLAFSTTLFIALASIALARIIE